MTTAGHRDDEPDQRDPHGEYTAHLVTLLDGTGWEAEHRPGAAWTHAHPCDGAATPPQGWKLHLSATPFTAIEVLDLAVPVLVRHGVPFKITPSLHMLVTLNQGLGGSSQIGKFATAYPDDANAAVAVARELDAALRHLAGPTIPSDRTLRPGGVVRYRYGGFEARWMQTPSGEIAPALERPDGSLVPDTRRGADAVPDWVDDPFVAAGLVEAPTPPPALVADRFRPVHTLHRTPHSAVFLALDLQDLRRCVLKRAKIDRDEWGAAARLEHEHEILDALSDVPAVVRTLGWFDDGDERTLAIEDIPGRTPMAREMDVDRGFTVPPERVLDTGLRLTAALAEVHRRGVVHRDIKPTNVIIQDDDTLRLIDFEISGRAGLPARGYGSLGYVSPQQAAQQPAQPTDDVYSVGAMLASLLVGTDAATRPANTAAGLRQIVLDLPPGLAGVVEQAMAADPAERPADAAELHDALLRVRDEPAPAVPEYGTLTTHTGIHPARAAEHARRMAAALVADTVETPTGRTWLSRHPASPGIPTSDVNTGSSGALIALAALADHFRDDELLTAVAEAAAWLDQAPRWEGDLLGGLYVGEGGVVTALLRAGRLLGDDRLLESARRRSRDIAALPHGSPDLFNGSAGRIRAHLFLASALGDDEALDAAVAAGRHLVRTAARPALGHATWTALAELGGGQQLGYAHGAAGIADTLLDLHDLTGEPSFLETAVDAARWLLDLAVPLTDGAVAFPSSPDDRPWAPLWCHGAAGIGRFLLHLDRTGHLDDGHRHVLHGTGVAAARVGRSLGPVMCHGIAGSIDHLLDLHAAAPDAGHLGEAWSLADVLATFHVEGEDGHLRSLGDHPGVTSPDLTVGYAGIATVWLRLADLGRPSILAL